MRKSGKGEEAMPVKRKTVALALAENVLAATDAATGLAATEACVQGEDGAVLLHAEIPADWQDLTVRLQVIAANGAYDESDPATGGVIEMPIRAGVAVPGPLTVRLSGSDGAGVRRTADCRSLHVTAGAVPAEPAPRLYPYAVHRITGSGGARVTQTENTVYNIDVSGTGGDMLEANYASGAGRANPNKTDHALYAESAELAAAAGDAAAGSALETALRTGWVHLPACAWASPTSFTIPGDWSTALARGCKIRLTQGADKFFFVYPDPAYSNSTGLTTVTVTGGSDYALSGGAISAPYCSSAASPAGFPDWFNWVPAWSAAGSMTYTPAVVTAKFKLAARSLAVSVMGNGTTAGAAASTIRFTLPFVPTADGVALSAFVEDGVNSPCVSAVAYWLSADTVAVAKYDGSNFGLGGGRLVQVGGTLIC